MDLVDDIKVIDIKVFESCELMRIRKWRKSFFYVILFDKYGKIVKVNK